MNYKENTRENYKCKSYIVDSKTKCNVLETKNGRFKGKS